MSFIRGLTGNVHLPPVGVYARAVPIPTAGEVKVPEPLRE
jgi:hypothetical protein